MLCGTGRALYLSSNPPFYLVSKMDNFEAANEPQRQPAMVVSKCWECGEEKECIEYIVCCTGTKFYICPECEKNIQEEG